jgi:hypothetical protein
MYVLYEHHVDESGEIFATDMIMTSVFPGRNWVNLKNRNEEAVFLFVKKTFKDVHTSKRVYSDEAKVWSFIGDGGRWVYDQLKDTPFVTMKHLTFEPVEDLMGQATAKFFKRPEGGAKWNPKDFFYQQAAPVQSSAPTREALASKLAGMLLISVSELELSKRDTLKRSYRQRALDLHPDRMPDGDSRAMSELNSLWQQYQIYLSA